VRPYLAALARDGPEVEAGRGSGTHAARDLGHLHLLARLSLTCNTARLIHWYAHMLYSKWANDWGWGEFDFGTEAICKFVGTHYCHFLIYMVQWKCYRYFLTLREQSTVPYFFYIFDHLKIYFFCWSNNWNHSKADRKFRTKYKLYTRRTGTCMYFDR